MKKITFVLFFIVPLLLFAQRTEFKGTVYDGINFIPIEGANIYNYNTKQFVFSDDEGNFSFQYQQNDTIIISKSIYRQLLVIINEEEMNKHFHEFFLYYKPTMLQEAIVYSFSSDYRTFLRDVAEMKLDDVYQKVSGIELSEFDKMNIEYANKGPNILRNTAAASPITYLYQRFNKKYRRDLLAQDLFNQQEEIEKLPLKYNRDIVAKLTGLKGKELLDFMTYCAFSYYDLINMSSEVIEGTILQKFTDYEYYKLLEE